MSEPVSSAREPAGGPRRRRPAPRLVEVRSVERVTPRMVSVVVAGEGLDGFATAAPTAHIKVFLPAPGQSAPVLPMSGPDGLVWAADAPRPIIRTYTPRRYDEQSGTLEVQFVMHGSGPASEWAARVQPGDRLGIAGPGGRFSFDPSVRSWWIAGDESALPAIGTLLDALPADASAEVHLEVDGPDDEMAFTSAAQLTVAWHHRHAGGWGDELLRAAQRAEMTPGTRWWVACEAAAVRAIRRHLLVERHVAAEALVTRGYWRAGEENYPDHDYGED